MWDIDSAGDTYDLISAVAVTQTSMGHERA